MSYRAITNAGFNLHDKVADVVSNGAWSWPVSWFDNFPVLMNVPTPILNDEHVDTLQWKMRDGTFRLFSVRDVWESIREQGNAVEWFQLVWSRHSIPRHATHLWLVMRKRLKTHDRMRPWDVGNDVDLNLLRCLLCKTQSDSHDHLFFECSYSSQVWFRVLQVAEIQFASEKWSDIMAWLLPISNQNNVDTIVARLILAVTSYFVWQERNYRVHGKGERNPELLSKVIVDMVRLKLASIQFKKKARVDKMRKTWRISSILIG